MKYLIATSALLLALSAQAEQPRQPAQNISLDKIHIGAGLTHNNLDSPFGGDVDANGFSVFAGYELENDLPQFSTYAEVGYAQTQDFFANEDIRGLWLSTVAVKQLPEINPRLSALARFGIDLGDDDGVFMGLGAQLQLAKPVALRAEYINKDATTVYQLSAVLSF